MKKLLYLIKTDLITMNGGKNNTRTLAVLMIIFCAGIGFILSPLVGVYCPFLLGSFFVPMIFQNEIKYHSEKLWSLLPIRRRDLVNSRFLLTIGIYVLACIAVYLLMLLALKLKPYYLFLGDDAKNMDIIALLAKRSDGAFTELGLFSLIYFTVVAIGLRFASGSLRKYFNDPGRFDQSLSLGSIRKTSKKEACKEIVYGLLIIAAIILWVMILIGSIPISAAAALIIQLCIQLAQAANGFLLGAVMIAWSVFSAIHKYVCTVLEFDEREL